VRQHEALLAAAGYSLAHVDIVRRVLPELVALAAMVAASVGDGLRALTGARPPPGVWCALCDGGAPRRRALPLACLCCMRRAARLAESHACPGPAGAGREDGARTAFQCARRVLGTCASVQQRLQSTDNSDLQVGFWGWWWVVGACGCWAWAWRGVLGRPQAAALWRPCAPLLELGLTAALPHRPPAFHLPFTLCRRAWLRSCAARWRR
jgi:hypothetical protein